MVKVKREIAAFCEKNRRLQRSVEDSIAAWLDHRRPCTTFINVKPGPRRRLSVYQPEKY
jgi:hypothetical protein